MTTLTREQLHERMQALRGEWQSLAQREREALQAGKQAEWVGVEYRRRKLPLELAELIQARAQHALQEAQAQLDAMQGEAQSLREQVEQKRAQLSALLQELNELERAYAPVAESTPYITVVMHQIPSSGSLRRADLQVRIGRLQDVVRLAERFYAELLENDPEATRIAHHLLSGEPLKSAGFTRYGLLSEVI